MSTPGITIKIEGLRKPVSLESSCLMAFVDETGDEHFSDPNHPVYGMGGCAILASDYDQVIIKPWSRLKEEYFGGASKALHANELRKPQKKQILALSDFFRKSSFSRFAAVASSKTAFPNGLIPYQAIAYVLLRTIEKVAKRFSFNRLVIMLEASSRTKREAEKYFGPFSKIKFERDGLFTESEVQYYWIPKKLNQPGIEVADFIMHTVGGQVRSRLKNPNAPFRKDFSTVFHSVPKDAQEYIEINKVE